MARVQTLSRNQQIVLDIIEKAKGPLKAYSILFNVQKKGINAPQQIYRALDKLIAMGKIHKIESKNAFVACRSSDCEISKQQHFRFAKVAKWLMKSAILNFQNIYQLLIIKKE